MTRCAPVSAGDPGPAPAPPHTDWLRHVLIVSGPVADVTALRQAAAGAGAIPWAYPDLDRLEEDQVHALVQPPDRSVGLSPAAARVLARQLRSAVETHHQQVLAASGTTPCPFDLHAIVPVPPDILQRGPDDPASHAWLQTYWGTTRALRDVRHGPDPAVRRPRRSARLHIQFWAADWTPWPVFAVLRERYPTLRFDIRPEYGDG
jgi:hypothetical protein